MAATQTDKTEVFRGRADAQKTLQLCYSASSALKTKTIRSHNFADVADVAWAKRFAARPLLYMFLPVLHGWNTHPLFRVLLTQNQNSGEGPWEELKFRRDIGWFVRLRNFGWRTALCAKGCSTLVPKVRRPLRKPPQENRKGMLDNCLGNSGDGPQE